MAFMLGAWSTELSLSSGMLIIVTSRIHAVCEVYSDNMTFTFVHVMFAAGSGMILVFTTKSAASSVERFSPAIPTWTFSPTQRLSFPYSDNKKPQTLHSCSLFKHSPRPKNAKIIHPRDFFPLNLSQTESTLSTISSEPWFPLSAMSSSSMYLTCNEAFLARDFRLQRHFPSVAMKIPVIKNDPKKTIDTMRMSSSISSCISTKVLGLVWWCFRLERI